MFTERLIDADGRRLNLAVGPANGPPLLLLHGVSRRWQDFVPLFPFLTPRWQVLALDFRGHGKSERAPRQYHVVEFVRDAVAIVEHLVSEPAVIFGHSLGALVAAGTAAQVPQLVRSVILEDPPSAELLRNIRGTPFFAQFSGMQLLAGDKADLSTLVQQLAAIPLPGPAGTTQRLGDSRDAAALRFSARCLKELDPDVFTSLIAGRWLDGYVVEKIMTGVTCPALILRGDESRGGMLTRTEAMRWTGAMRDGTLIDVPHVGHLLHWMATETTARLTLAFLESLR